MKTFSPTPKDIKHDWFVVDAQGLVLGRLASQLAHRLRGKHKPEFAPHMDNGDCIVVVNCEKVKVTGTKMQSKLYRRHSGWVGGLKTTNLSDMLAAHPEYREMPNKEQLQTVCDIIDRHIHRGYEIFERGTEFDTYIESRLALIDIPNKDEAFLRERLYEMYNNPVKNYEKSNISGVV